MNKVTYAQVADDLIHGGWYFDNKENVTECIKSLSNEMRAVILLADIAQSLRVLRCPNFMEIPWTLREIKRNTKRRKKAKNKGAVKP